MEYYKSLKFGEVLKSQRNFAKLSVNQLANLSNISNTYISKLENLKRGYPTYEVVLSLASGFRKDMSRKEEMADVVVDLSIHTLEEFLKCEDSPYKDLSEDIYYKDFMDFYVNMIEKELNSLSKEKENIFKNKVMLRTKTEEFEVTNLPYFDLDWLLSQNEFELFYGREFDFKLLRDKQMLSKKEMYFYNSINENDKKFLKEILNLYINNKYTKIINPLEFYKYASDKESMITSGLLDYYRLYK